MKRFILVLITALSLGGCTSPGSTNHIYLIPEGYEGSFTVFFGITGAPELEKKGAFAVIPLELIKIDTLHQTENSTFGYALTSRKEPYLPKASTYEINNKYYYIDQAGKRQEIETYCVHERGVGGNTDAEGQEIGYVDLQVTQSECGEDFYLNGKQEYTTQSKEAKKVLINKLD
ncbi:hypothetical protein I7V34_15120 [Bacillus sp. V3]|nr:hypothetical protein I7V34_15120 [Bacillus sp. V3]